MINTQNSNPSIYPTKRSIKILRRNTLVDFLKRVLNHLRRKPLQNHWIVVSYKYRAEVSPPKGDVEYEFKEIKATDHEEIDELTAVDVWKVPKSVTLRKLRQGHHVYIAKHQGRIVASHTIIMRDRFQDPVLMREFKMASNEAFHLRAFCIPEFRGRGIFPVLVKYCLRDAEVNYGITKNLALIRIDNRNMLRSVIPKVEGVSRVGRAGFIEIFGFRFHYLLGREAFKETRKRFFIQNMVGVHPVFQGVTLKLVG
jgi:GNAT superfamily N-acetyltransferase